MMLYGGLHNGHFGLLSNPDFKRPLASSAESVPEEIDIDKWLRFVTPMDDQKQSGMCQSFSSMQALRILLRAKSKHDLFTGVPHDPTDDLTLDPRIGHRLSHAKTYPDKPYSHHDGLYAGTTIDVLREAGYLSPGTTTTPIQWHAGEIIAALDRGPLELPLLAHDGWTPERMSANAEIPPHRDPMSRLGGHSTCCPGAKSFSGELLLRDCNSWRPWGWNGMGWISLRLATIDAIDRPQVIEMADPEWYAEHDEWRELLILRSVLDAELAMLRTKAA